jgi:hypothetical protein
VRATTPAQVVLSWHLGMGNIVIPKSTPPGPHAREPLQRPISLWAGTSWTRRDQPGERLDDDRVVNVRAAIPRIPDRALVSWASRTPIATEGSGGI